MRKSDITLEKVRESSKVLSKPKERIYRASDFLTKDEQAELRSSNIMGRKQKRKFSDVDAFVAEIIARFGYEAYRAWKAGEIPTDKMQRMMFAERAREKNATATLYSVIISTVSCCIRRYKGEPKPKALKDATAILKREIKMAEGVF